MNWTPEGQIGELFKIMGAYLPAPPDDASAPPLGRWEECREEIYAMAERRNEATDGSLLIHAEYLVAVGFKPGSTTNQIHIA